jgi:hypothetical protein
MRFCEWISGRRGRISKSCLQGGRIDRKGRLQMATSRVPMKVLGSWYVFNERQTFDVMSHVHTFC